MGTSDAVYTRVGASIGLTRRDGRPFGVDIDQAARRVICDVLGLQRGNNGHSRDAGARISKRGLPEEPTRTILFAPPRS